MRIVFFGTPHFVVPVLDAIKTHFDLVGVVTTPDEKTGRKQLLTPSPVKQAVPNDQALHVLTPASLTKEVAEQLKALQPDFFIVAAYGKIIPKEILDIPTHGSINIHPSLLPQYRGPSPIQSTILNGDTTTGVTLILMDEEVDHGPILAQKAIQLTGNETFATLADELFKLSADMLPDVMKKLASNSLPPREQNHTDAIFCDHITKEDGYLDSTNPPAPDVLDRMIRAYFPWPTTWTKVLVRNSEKIVKFLPGKKIQMEGKNAVGIKEFLNGYPELTQLVERLLGVH